MKHVRLVLVASAVAFATACASPPVKTEPPVAAKEETAPAKEAIRKERAAPEAEIVGKPAAGSKFARLRIGMTLKEVERLIGPPTRQWQHPTEKASTPYYFGPDRWVIQYAYKNEGVLTFNYGEDQLLTRIEVNKAE